jgi:hypothetical protein
MRFAQIYHARTQQALDRSASGGAATCYPILRAARSDLPFDVTQIFYGNWYAI